MKEKGTDMSFLDRLIRRFIPDHLVIPQGISTDPVAEMEELVKRMKVTYSSSDVLAISERMLELSTQLRPYLKNLKEQIKIISTRPQPLQN